ncbi:MAG: 50S ribosomal protein L9 [Clostridiales bacterium]|nr:50S ribosomal protein L9 [Clostridiales bacterium]
MKIILLEDVKSLGKKGDLVEVNDGYARNFLIPKKLGTEATSAAINNRKQRLAKEAKIKAEEKEKALALYNSLKGQTIDIKVKCGDGKMYGSVTTQDIAKELENNGFKVDKKNVKLKENIRALGKYPIEIWCYPNYTATITLNVIKE